MALGFQKRKLNTIRSRVSQDAEAREASYAEGYAKAYAIARAEDKLEIAGLRQYIVELSTQISVAGGTLKETFDRAGAAKQALRQSEAQVASQKADIALLKAAIETMKAEVTATRMASREPRKAAVNECLAILKRERTVARSEAVLRNMLKDL